MGSETFPNASINLSWALTSDDPTNASGLGPQAVALGCVFLSECTGLVTGSGQTLAVREANATVIQNAINYAFNNNLIFVVSPGVYEFYSSTGLNIPIQPTFNNSFKWLGSQGARFLQFYATSPGAPCMTIGDATGTTLSYHYDIDGGSFEFGAAQTGFTNSSCLVIGPINGSSIRRIRAGGASATNPGYYAVLFPGVPGGSFSCSFEDWELAGAQQTLLYIGYISTGCVWKNIACGNNYLALSGPAFYMNGGNEQHFDQLNIEGVNAQYMISVETNEGAIFGNVHIERCELTGSNPAIFALQNSSVAVQELTIVDCYMSTTVGTSGTPAVFNNYTPAPGAVTKIGNVIWTCNSSGEINLDVYLFVAAGLPSDNVNILSCESIYLQDYGGTSQLLSYFSFDSHMPVSSTSFFPPNTASRYDYGKGGSRVSRAVIPVNATYTHYGQHENSTLVVPAAAASAFTITLAATQGATGTQAVRTGTTCNVRRASGTESNTVLIKNDAGTTLATSTTAATDYWFVFNGTHYVAFTPVT